MSNSAVKLPELNSVGAIDPYPTIKIKKVEKTTSRNFIVQQKFGTQRNSRFDQIENVIHSSLASPRESINKYEFINNKLVKADKS